MNELLSKINVLSELEQMGVAVQFVSESQDEVLVSCPFHADKKPSCSVSLTKKVFKCHSAGCGQDGDFVTFMARATDRPRRLVTELLERRYGLRRTIDSIPRDAVEKYHRDLMRAKPLLASLYERGIDDAAIRKYRLGRIQSRIVIPIFDEFGECLNLRKYLPGAPSGEKFKNLSGRGDMRLFPVDQFVFKEIVICGGELKAIATAMRMNPHGIGAVTSTGGEGSWKPEFTEKIVGKSIYVCNDIDDAGVHATEHLCARLLAHVPFLAALSLPLDREKYPRGDLSDYWGLEKKTDQDFLILLRSAKRWDKPTPTTDGRVLDVVDVEFIEMTKPEYTTKRIRVEAMISAIVESPYAVPHTIACACNRDQEFCSMCPVFYARGDNENKVTLKVDAESPAILSMVAAPMKSQREAIRHGLGIPPCKTVRFTALDWYTIEEIRISPKIEMTSRASDSVTQPAFVVGHGLELNETYALSGRPLPHPKNQQIVLLCSERRAVQDALSTFSIRARDHSELSQFRPRAWTLESIHAKLESLYADLETNVTRIFCRRQMHLAADLCFHSPLLMKFDGQIIKAWTEVLILGDSSQGKSEMTTRLMEHYGVGARVDCKNASAAGLLGGLQNIGNRWMISWGVIPHHDRRLVILEELKGASVEVISRLTEMRSTGIASTDKIEKRRTHARTRLLAISNPRRDVPISSYSFGLEAVKELIGSLEDIRRFDLALIVASSQIDTVVLNKLTSNRPVVSHEHMSDACRTLILWAWTRTPDQVKFTNDATECVTHRAIELSSKFTEAVPLIDKGSTRLKVARLASALAARTFSTNGDEESILVRREHVDYVCNFIDAVYSSAVFGYEEFSEAIKIQSVIRDPIRVKKKILATTYPDDFIQQLFHHETIEFRDIRDWCAWDYDTTLEFVSALVLEHALVRDGRVYRKNAQLNALLKELRGSDELKRANRPSHIEEF